MAPSSHPTQHAKQQKTPSSRILLSGWVGGMDLQALVGGVTGDGRAIAYIAGHESHSEAWRPGVGAPHEGNLKGKHIAQTVGDLVMRLYQTGRIVMVVQALLVGGLAVAGLFVAAGSPTGVGHIAGFSLNIPHSLLLLATAGASLLAALWSRIGRLWVMAQATLYTLVYVIGTAASTGHSQDTWLRLNTPDHFLHLGLALVGGVLIPTLFWPTAPDTNSLVRILPGEPPPAEQRSARSPQEESEKTRSGTR